MKKRGFSLLLAILILVAQIPFAFEVTASGTCGDNLTWTLDDSGTLTISGTGRMYDYKRAVYYSFFGSTETSADYPPWVSYSNDIFTSVINNGVTMIGDSAFNLCENLTSVTLPNSVTNIGSNAFESCSSLTNITLPNSLTSIGDWAFRRCSNLTNITIPDSVANIGEGAFEYCSSLTNITIPNSVIYMGNSAFRYCSNLQSVTISASASWEVWRERSVFSDCYALKNAVFLPGATTIGANWFEDDDNLSDVVIPDSVVSVEDTAFNECYNLKNVYYSGSQQQWKAINIGEKNNYLQDATIHYNSSAPDSEPVAPSEPIMPTPVEPEPVAPTPVEPAPQINSEISKYSYAFDNSAKSFGYVQHQKLPHISKT